MDYSTFITPQWAIIFLFLGAILTYFAGRYSAIARYSIALLFSGLSLLIVAMLYDKPSTYVWTPSILPESASIYIVTNPLSWFFGIMLAGIAFLTLMYSIPIMKGKRGENMFYTLSLILTAALMGVVFSGDILSFFIFWEIMTLSSYLLVTLAGKRADKAALNYMILSTVGAYSMLIGMMMIYVRSGSTEFSAVSSMLSGADPGFLWISLGLVSVGFLVKAASLPFYIWAPPAYSEAPDGFTPLFSGGLSKLGAYGFMIFMYGLAGMSALMAMGTFRGISSFGYAIALLGSITSVIATLYAIAQDDIKKLLAYSSVSQLGYVLMGIGIGTSVGVAGGLYHALNHALFKTTLFMGAGVLIYTTGSRKLSDMGGLATKMPITFITMLIAVFALAGIPMTGGFGSKWLLYEAAIDKGFVFIAPLAFVASVGAFLYAFRILQSAFLGQLPEKLEDAKDPSPLISIPMIIMAGILVLFGIAPGIPLGIIANVEAFIGIAPIDVSMYSVYLGAGFGAYNAMTVMTVITAALLVGIILFVIGSKSKKVGQTDTYMAGEIPEHHVDMYMHYSANFYRPIERLFEPYLRERLEAAYEFMGESYETFSDLIRRVYTGDVRDYVFYVLGFLAFMVIAGWWLM